MNGWEKVEGEEGLYKGPGQDNHLTPEFLEFAESSRARWDMWEYIKVKLKQWKKKGPFGILRGLLGID